MIRIIRFLLTGDWHLHQWETVNTVLCRCIITGWMWERRTARCKCCGKVKSFDGKSWIPDKTNP